MTTQNLVIGFPLEHTLSPVLHSMAYADLGLDVSLVARPGEDIAVLVDGIRQENSGLTAVTMPHKQSIIPLLDEVEERAHAIGAVNTVVNRGGHLMGYNTDIVGIEWALRELDMKGEDLLILGAGGAARPLAHWGREQCATLFCMNRNPERAEALMADYGGRALSEEALHRKLQAGWQPKLITNMTPLGMAPHDDQSPLDPELMTMLDSKTTIFDVIYRPRQTLFIQAASRCGLKTISGLDMFVAQGLEQIRLWSGHSLDPSVYLVKLDAHLKTL